MSVFERLTSHKNYTGMHAFRYAAGGGLNADRDSVTEMNLTHHPERQFRNSLHEGDKHGFAGTGFGQGTDRTRGIRSRADAEERMRSHHKNATVPTTVNGKLEYLFEHYCSHGRTALQSHSELESRNFIKFCRDTPGLMRGSGGHGNIGDEAVKNDLTVTDCDLIFAKAHSGQSRRLNYSNFIDALTAVSHHKFPDEDPKTVGSHYLLGS